MDDRFKMARAEPEELWDQPDTFKKKVALYGGGFTRTLILDHPLVDDDCEIWSGNYVWQKWGQLVFGGLDRSFDIHQTELLEGYSGEGDKEHFAWLQKRHPFPIYMMEPDERFPSAVRYPYEEVSKDIFSKVYRGKDQKRAFGSTIDFMAALAMHEGYDWIGYFGIEMTDGTEYRYQNPDAHFHLGFAAGRGVTTWVPDDARCNLLKRQVYAYEGYQMVSRHTLEILLKDYEKQRREWVDAANSWTGAYRMAIGELQEARQKSDNVQEIHRLQDAAQELGDKVRNSRETAAEAQGMMKAIEHLIQTIDLEEPDTKLTTTVFDNVPLEEVRP